MKIRIKLIAMTFLLLFVLSGFFSVIFGENVFVLAGKTILRRAGVYTEEIPSVTIQQTGYSTKTPGTWGITKSAKWTSSKTAEVIFDVNSVLKADEKHKDVIFIMDVSGSMLEKEKLVKAKSDAKTMIDAILSDSHNNVALIKFETTSEIVSNFTKDGDLLKSKIDDFVGWGETNYNGALQNVLTVLENYEKKSNYDLVFVLLTDGYPNNSIHNERATYQLIKDKYPYLIAQGVQYEMGNTIRQELIDVSDNQYVANKKNLEKVLLDASVNPDFYDDFKIVDYIHDDYFTVENVSDIKVPYGTVTLEPDGNGQKITWDLSGLYRTGTNIQMKIKLTLKQQYVGEEGFYPTNKGEEIKSKLPEEESKTQTSSETPVLSSSYRLIYDSNVPTGCTTQDLPTEKHMVYEIVEKKDNPLSCQGYLFKGWEFDKEDEEDIQKMNDDYFFMPDHDVTIRGVWTKHSIEKSTHGEVHTKQTLYDVLKNAATVGTYAKEYTGEHKDSFTQEGNEKIYHWYASDATTGESIQNQNNVVFAGQCWQMYRTTDTGGVKLVYNGEEVNGKCLDTRGDHIGYGARELQYLTGNYYYGTSYAYDSTTKKFQIAGDVEQTTWNATTGPNLVGKYTCKATSATASCDTLYLVESYNSATQGNVLPLNFNSHYSRFGAVRYGNASSLSEVGYMNNKKYIISSSSTTSTYAFANSVTYNNGVYQLQNSIQNTFTGGIHNTHYTCLTTEDTCAKVYYVTRVNGSTAYYLPLENGETIEDAMTNMLHADDVNKNNSIIKNAVDAWYKRYLSDYSHFLENAIYCNDRTITNQAGWSPNSADISQQLQFREYNMTTNLGCTNITDQFSMDNTKAKLTYPIGLLTNPEANLLGNDAIRKGGESYWGMSPNHFGGNTAGMRYVRNTGGIGNNAVTENYGVRPVITLLPGTEFYDGEGSKENPYRVSEAPLQNQIAPTVFATDSWETIVNNVKNENTDQYNVGDTKEVDLGTYGIHTLRIANKSRPTECEEDGFSQTACGFVLEFADIITTHNMNDTSTNVGGWPATSMRAYVNTDIYNAIPEVLRNSIVDTEVVSYNYSYYEDHKFLSTDKIYLLDDKEVYNTYENSKSRQLDYYANQGVDDWNNYSPTIKRKNGNASSWWLRSVYEYNQLFEISESTGQLGHWNATNNTAGVSPAFRIGNGHTMTLDPQNGGSIVTMKTDSYTLPVLERCGYILSGWYDAAIGGNKIGDGGVRYNPTKNITLYAQWTLPQSTTFEADSWDTIINNVRNGNTSDYAVGDEKAIDMGSLGCHKVRIANKSTPTECSTTGFSQTACGFVLEFADIITEHNMNDISTSAGGWPASSMRSYVNSDIYNAIPETLRNAIIDTSVVSGYACIDYDYGTYNCTTPDNDGNSFISTDKIYLLSPKEVWGNNTSMNDDNARNQSRQLDYYSGKYFTPNYHGIWEAIKKRNRFDSGTWFLRSPYFTDGKSFGSVSGLYGSYWASSSTSTSGVSPAFRIG